MRAARPCHLTGFVVGTVLAIAAPRTEAEPVRKSVVAGDHVRYRTSDGGEWQKADVLDVRPHSWLVRPEHRDPVWVSTSSLRRAEVFREKGPLVAEGFFLGFVPGALLGAHYVAFACLDYEGPGTCPSAGTRLGAALVVGGSLGGIGAVIAKLVKPEQWDPIVGEHVHVTVAPTLGPRGRGLGASVSVRF
jgi:hypothetical protein